MKVLLVFFSCKFILFLKRKTKRTFQKRYIWVWFWLVIFLIIMDTNRLFIARFKTVIRIKIYVIYCSVSQTILFKFLLLTRLFRFDFLTSGNL